jgi:hypothetical protein
MQYYTVYFIGKLLYMFRVVPSSIIRSTQAAAGYHPAAAWVNATRYCKLQSSAPDDGRKHRPKHIEPTWNNKLTYIVHLVGHFHNCITMHSFMNVKFIIIVLVVFYSTPFPVLSALPFTFSSALTFHTFLYYSE